MKTNNKSRSKDPKHNKREKSTSGAMKIFYILMLLLLASSSLIRIAGAKGHASQAVETPTSENSPLSGLGTTARIFVFHRAGDVSGICTDLTVTAAGNAIYSNCGKGVEKQYSLTDAEMAKIQGWVEEFQPINYDNRADIQAGKMPTQLYLNSQGSQQAGDGDIQQMIDFAVTLSTKVASQP
jgi:hypothetical protein